MPMRSLAFSARPRRSARMAWAGRSMDVSVPPVLTLGVSWATAVNVRNDAAEAQVMICRFRFIFQFSSVVCVSFLEGFLSQKACIIGGGAPGFYGVLPYYEIQQASV